MKRKILVFLVLACVLMTASTAMAKTVSITFRDLFSGPDSDLMDDGSEVQRAASSHPRRAAADHVG